MAERIVSPAVFTNEIDSTFLVEGISAIGGAIVACFHKRSCILTNYCYKY